LNALSTVLQRTIGVLERAHAPACLCALFQVGASQPRAVAVAMRLFGAVNCVSEWQMRRTLLVFPSYAVGGVDERTLYVLRQAGVLPNDLGAYTTTGAAKDALVMRNIIGSACEYTTLDCEVTAATLEASLHWLLAPDTSLALLLFGGHGVFDGTMVCSFKQLVAAETVDDIATKQRFRGTFVRVLNMCGAGSEPSPSNNPAHPQGPSSASPLSPPVSGSAPPPWSGITVAATTPFGQTSGESTGSKLMAAMQHIFTENRTMAYEDVGAALSRHLPQAQVHVHLSHPDITGPFGHAAVLVRGGDAATFEGSGFADLADLVDPHDPDDPDVLFG
jgi:hypothetical protein